MKRASFICALAIAAATLGISTLSTAGEVLYRWDDAQGNPVHSDRPPPKGIDYEVISTGSKFVRPVDADEGVVPLELEPSAGNEFEKVNSDKPKVKKNPEFCQRARDNLDALNSNVRLRIRNDQGEMRILDEEERIVQKRAAQDNINIHCK